MDKISIGFMADVLYIKGIICFEEFEAIQDAKSPIDMNTIVERMLLEGKEGGFNGKRKGESYIGYADL